MKMRINVLNSLTCIERKDILSTLAANCCKVFAFNMDEYRKKNLGFVNALVFQSPWMDRATIETTVEVLIKEIVRSSPSTRIWTIRKPIEGDSIYDVYHVLPNKKVVNR
jgi:hypothetical protein